MKCQDFADMLGKGIDDATMASLENRFCFPTDEKAARDRAIFLVLSRTALRAAEVVALRWSLLFKLPEGAQAFRVRVKGGKAHIVVPGPQVLEALRAYHRVAGIKADSIFHSLPLRSLRGERCVLGTRGLRLVVSRWEGKTGLGRQVHPHSLRHTAVQKVFDVAGSIAAQKLAGHSSPLVTSKHYTRPYYAAASILSWGGDAA